MLTIATYAFRERIRKKEFYIILLVAVLIFLLYGSGNVSIMIDGKTMSDFDVLFVVLHEVLFGVACILSFVMSLPTIPNEYERHSSHLVWTRGISQTKYHVGLALSNVFVSLLAATFFHLLLTLFCIKNGQGDFSLRGLLSLPIMFVAVCIVSVFTSVLSIRLPRALTGLLGVIFLIFGVFHGLLRIYESISVGFAGRVLAVMLAVIPDLHGIGAQARHLMTGEAFRSYVLWYGLLFLYLLTFGFVFIRKEQA